MIKFAAPAELPEVTMSLPGSNFGNVLSPLLEVKSMRSMNNTLYTYVKNKKRKKLEYSIMLPLPKQLEFQEFVKRFLTSYWRITESDGTIYKAKLISEPVTYTQKDRSNRAQVQLTFEGVLEYAPESNC